MITIDIARQIENLGLEKIQVRSPMTCEAPLGICRSCYGMDLSTGSMVEEGMAVGIIAAQSIGEPGTQLTMRTFHIGGVGQHDVEKNEIRAQKAGTVQYTRLKVVVNQEGANIVLARNGQITILDPKGREVEKYEIPTGAALMVDEKAEVKAGEVICQWDPHSIPILAEVTGKVRYEDVREGDTMRLEKDVSGHVRRVITEHKGDLHPQVVLENSEGKTLDFYYLPERANIEVNEGESIIPGTLLGKTPREASGTQDITGGLPRVTEIFEARKPKDPAVIAEIDGIVELLGEKRRGKRTLVIRSASGIEKEHLISHGKHLRVHAGDEVRAGESLVDGPLVPHDILRVSGEEAVQQYLGREIQNVYRSQRVEINDKHIEIIVAQMLRKVKIESAGDTKLLRGNVLDKFEFREYNESLANCVKISTVGDSEYALDSVVPKEALQQTNAQIEALGGKVAKGSKPKPATASTQLLGITKASVQSTSFISAASFQETTKVLTEAALSGKVDRLVGLKENVILGHLVPAGTGFHSFQDSEVRIRPEALEALTAEKDLVLSRSFPLLDAAIESEEAASGNEGQGVELLDMESLGVEPTGMGESSIPEPGMGEPSIPEPGMGEPSIPEPGMGEPSIPESSMGESSIPEHGMGGLGMEGFASETLTGSGAQEGIISEVAPPQEPGSVTSIPVETIEPPVTEETETTAEETETTTDEGGLSTLFDENPNPHPENE